MASIKDVAKRASVSVGTVSRAFNGYSDIKQETKERIFEAARMLNYVPNANARSLSSKVTNNIGVLMSGLLEGNDKDNQAFKILKGVYQYAQEHDYQISLYAIDSKEQRKRSYSDFCMEHNIAGAVLHGITTRDPYFKELVDFKIPCVAIDITVTGKKVGCISIDNYEASRQLMNYVIEQNHRNIVIIAGKKDTEVTVKRLAGSMDALKEKDIKLKAGAIVYCNFQEQAAYEKTKALIQNTRGKKNAPTIFVCQSDIMALGVYRAIRDLGFQIPDDFSVTGFDGSSFADYISPTLTTVGQDMVQHGYEATRLLVDIIKDNVEGHNVVVEFEIKIGDSVKKMQ